MLKLNSVNGKFDIVFSSDPLVADVNHKKFLGHAANRSLTRGNKHLKSSLDIPKLKFKKVTPTKNNRDGKVPQPKKTLTPRKKSVRASEDDQSLELVGKSTNQNRKNKKGENVSNLKRSTNKRAIFDNVETTTNKQENLNANNELSLDAVKGDTKAVTVVNNTSPERVADKNILPSVQVDNNSDMARRDIYDFGNTNAISNNQADGFISRQNLNNMFRGFFEESNAVVEPLNIPGLNFSTINTNTNKLRQIENPTHPLINLPAANSNNFTPVSNSYQVSTDKRDKMIRKYQSNMEVQEDYYPWGRPGCGAPLKDKDQNTIADLKSYKSRGRTKSADVPKVEVNNTLFANVDNTHLSDNTLQENTKDMSQQYSNSANSHMHGANFARGQVKSQFELEDIQKRKHKELEHQNAIRQQVEEKRRLKQVEKDREMREEKEAEERFHKQQSKMKEMAEKEKQKQQEKDDKLRKQKELLEENIRKANEEAKKARESKQHAQDKQRKKSVKHVEEKHVGRNVSRGNAAEHHLHNNGNNLNANRKERQLHTHNGNDTEANSVRRRLHHDDSPISTVQNKYRTNDLATASQDFNFVNTINKGNNDQYASAEIESGRGNETFTHSPSNDITNHTNNNHTNNKINLRNKHIPTKLSVSSPDLDTGRNSRSLYEKLYGKEPDSSVNFNFSSRKKSSKSSEKLNRSMDNRKHSESDTFDKIFNDYLVPYRRSETTGLIDTPKPILTSEAKKPVKEEEESKRNTGTDVHFSPNMLEPRVSSRQQQILNQLHALREGLMRKEREYVLERFS